MSKDLTIKNIRGLLNTIFLLKDRRKTGCLGECFTIRATNGKWISYGHLRAIRNGVAMKASTG